MSIRVEFYGIPRKRAAVDQALVESVADPMRLGDVLQILARQFPALAEECIDGQRLRPNYVANVAGTRFVSDPDTLLGPCESLIILSADAGG